MRINDQCTVVRKLHIKKDTMVICVLLLLLLAKETLEDDNNLIKLIKDNIAVSSSSPHWKTWTAAKAVDFVKDSDPDHCECCSGSTNENAWWRLDLGNEYKIRSISFVGRSDRESKQSRGFNIYNGFSNSTTSRATLLYTNNAASGYTFIINLNQSTPIRYLEINSTYKLTICEIEIYQQEINLIKEIHENLSTDMSLKWQNWSAEKAVDLDERTQPDDCTCCSGTLSRNAWWRLNLQAKYPIHKIYFIGRSDDFSEQSRGFEIYEGFSNGSNAVLIYKNNDTEGNSFSKYLHPPVVMQHIEINSTNILSICELKLIKSDVCPTRTFGEHCQYHCHCIDERPCDRYAGGCRTTGCEAGWQGESCDKGNTPRKTWAQRIKVKFGHKTFCKHL